MKVHLVVLTIIDFDELGAEDVKAEIENTHYANHCISPDVYSVETVDIGEWRDDHPLNFQSSSNDELRKLFPSLSAHDIPF